MNEALMSSEKHDWETPQWLYDHLNETFQFTLDVCAHEDNYKHSNYFSEAQDGLSQEWHGTCWMNPPYGKRIGKWMKKAYESSKNGATVVCLIPARTCTAWWHDYAIQGEITFLRGRLKFGGAMHSAPFPSAIVVWHPNLGRQGTFFLPAKAEGIKQICKRWI